MDPFNIALLGWDEVAASTFAFRFAKPKAFAFAAGQSIDLSLATPADESSAGRTLQSVGRRYVRTSTAATGAPVPSGKGVTRPR